MDSSISESVGASADKTTRSLEIWLALLVVALDQMTKALVRARLPLHDSVTVVAGLMDFTHVRNTGAAFGFLNGADFPFKPVVIALVATAALVGVGFYAAGLAHHQLAARIGLALIIGGAAGNLLDRVVVGSSSISWTCTGARTTSGRSTSPTPPSRSASPS